MEKKLAVGVLAFNEELNIEKVVKELLDLNLMIYVLDDNSSDDTLNILNSFKTIKNIKIITNKKNYGAGYNAKKLIKIAKDDGFDFVIKVDGDGQFLIEDIKKIIEIYNKYDFKFIKSNRFWNGGILGDIPKIRYIGNLLATLLMQISSGSAKVADPLNGLYGISVDILEFLNKKNYPQRYGYPFYFNVVAIQNEFKTLQLNNSVLYSNQKSGLNSFVVLITLLKLTIYFYFLKFNLKKKYFIYQKSAIFDSLFLYFLIVNITTIIYLLLITFFGFNTFIKSSNLFILIVILTLFAFYFFVQSIKEESVIRKQYIFYEDEIY